MQETDPDSALVRKAVALSAILAMVGAALLFALFIWSEWTRNYWAHLIETQFAAIVGLPMAAAGAFIVVAMFRQTEGPIEIELPAFKLKGATGPVLLWVVCFAVITWAIKQLWIVPS